jgi:SAM-dependent methyltransferase
VTAALEDGVLWHDVECGAYRVDLPLWRELADQRDGPLLELGCGSGRVALDLAARGHRVTALDSDAALVGALRRRARERGLRIAAVSADARSLSLPDRFGLAIAPMQVIQLLGGASGRRRLLAAVRRHLKPGGLFAAALADPFEAVAPDEALPPLPDVREQSGWVLSSTPVAVRPEPDGVAVDRLRQAVTPQGELSESLFTVRLDRMSASRLEAEAREAGFRPLPARAVPETHDHVGSTVVLLETPR